MWQVTFSAWGQLTCNTTQWHKHQQQWREERCTFSSWKYSHYFEFVSAKDENMMVCCTLCAKYYQASKTQHQIWRNIWSRSTVKFTEQVPPGGVKQRAASKATASTSAGGPPPPKQQKLDFSAKQVSGGAALKHGWLALVSCHNKQDPYYYQRCAWQVFCTLNNAPGEYYCNRRHLSLVVKTFIKQVFLPVQQKRPDRSSSSARRVRFKDQWSYLWHIYVLY